MILTSERNIEVDHGCCAQAACLSRVEQHRRANIRLMLLNSSEPNTWPKDTSDDTSYQEYQGPITLRTQMFFFRKD